MKQIPVRTFALMAALLLATPILLAQGNDCARRCPRQAEQKAACEKPCDQKARKACRQNRCKQDKTAKCAETCRKDGTCDQCPGKKQNDKPCKDVKAESPCAKAKSPCAKACAKPAAGCDSPAVQ